MPTESSVAAPVAESPLRNVLPVTLSVPPTVAAPLVLSVVVPTLPVLAIPAVVVAPVTPRVPPTVALLVTPTELRVAAP